MLFQWMRIRLHFTQRFIQQLLVPDLIIEPTFYKFLQKEVSGPLNQSSLSLRCTTAQGHISRIHRPLYRQPDPINRHRPRVNSYASSASTLSTPQLEWTNWKSSTEERSFDDYSSKSGTMEKKFKSPLPGSDWRDDFVIVPFSDNKIFKLFPLTITSSAICWTIYLNKFGLGKTLEFGNVSLRYFHLAYFTFVKSGGNAVDT